MTVVESLMTGCRHALAGPMARRGVVLLALVVLTVQFGLIQHVIDAGPQHAEATCAFCVAGDHNSPLLTDADGGKSSPAAAPVEALCFRRPPGPPPTPSPPRIV